MKPRGLFLQCWLPVILLPGVVVILCRDALPGWAFMWVLSFAIFAACKWLTWREAGVEGVPVWRHWAYFLGWPGLDARGFLQGSPRGNLAKVLSGEWVFSFAKLGIGIGLVWEMAGRVPADQPYLAGWVGMAGIVMILHFGVFHML